MPGMGSMAEQVDEGEIRKVEAMIGSMTTAERKRPDVIDKSRVARIARGSGRKQKEVSDLVKRFYQMRDMMKALGQNEGLLSRIPGMDRLAGAGPGGIDPSAMLGGPALGAGRRAPPMRAKNTAQAKKRKRKQAKKSRQQKRKK